MRLLPGRYRLLKFESIDLPLTPTKPCTAFAADADAPPSSVDNIIAWMSYTYPFNLTGQPAASIPVGFSLSGLPIGLQMVAKINHEVDIFRAAAAYEKAQPWATKLPGFAHSSSRSETSEIIDRVRDSGGICHPR